MIPTSTALLVRPNIPEKRKGERHRFIKILKNNLSAALREGNPIPLVVEDVHGFILIRGDAAGTMALKASGVFGVGTVAKMIETNLKAQVSTPSSAIVIENPFDPHSDAIIYNHDSSRDEELIGNLRELLRTNHSQYKTIQSVLILQDRVFVSVEELCGIGGLPTGSEGHVVCMISSGLDSPVAAFKVMRRGCVPIFVYFDNSPFSDDINKKVAIEQATRLSEYIHGTSVKMLVVPHGEDLVEVLKYAPRRMTCVFCRRNMYRLAQEVALREGADAIITGEIIGEQASQTTRNLFAEDSAIARVPIIRPCIGDDKDEITKQAREIGTYEFTNAAASCCSLPPKYPVLHADIAKITTAEIDIGYDWVKDAVSDAEIIVLKGG